MKVYIATKYENLDQYRILKDMLEKAGHDITYDWSTRTLEKVPAENHINYLIDSACYDFNGVRMCHVLVIIEHLDMKGPMLKWVLLSGSIKK